VITKPRRGEPDVGRVAADDAPRSVEPPDLDNLFAGLAAVATLGLLGALLWPDAQQRAIAVVLALLGLVASVGWLLFRLSAAWLHRG
jgi:hypothetical protein